VEMTLYSITICSLKLDGMRLSGNGNPTLL
jgi:hypothetical protein